MSEMRGTARRRELGDELRRVRESADFTQSDLAHQLGWSSAKLCRIESGKLGCSEVDAAILLSYLRVTGPYLHHVLSLCGATPDGSWLQQHGGLPDQLRTLVLHETKATGILALELNQVDGLLQTEEYARALIRGTGLVPEAGVEVRVRARMDRQAILCRRNPPDCTFYIHEQALRLPVGTNQVMHEQMLRLVLLSARSYCAVRVIPTAVGPHAGLGGPFRVMQYPDEHPVISLETHNRSLFLESQVDIATYWLILGRLAEVALNREESRSLLAQLASDYDRAESSSHGSGDNLA
ncbi:helix-turn-helix domain-containing protein [Actinokineospora sp.]|uniref:helix-turn-helix domain-containing protein n=1 Tax=Actinokineospora sp. TaxID=1872133 RepID=UPI0040384E57